MVGHLFLVDWRSTVIRRVSRSTLQSETLSLVLGSDEAEQLRCNLYGIKWNLKAEEDYVKAMDTIKVMWITDCRSLYEHVVHAGLQNVSDKRLAIDLCSLRQMAWRQQGEMVGDPLLTDFLPDPATTKIEWTSTDKMVADALTKHMKPGLLLNLIMEFEIDMTPTKEKGCKSGATS